jgi:N-acetylglucosamine-6-phosphate deacetylase
MHTSPQFVDLQINGYAGVDFNADNLSAEQLHFACERLREDGVAGILATIITAELPKMSARLRRIADICQQDPLVSNVVWGLHIEGPFINETVGYVGAHPPQDVRSGDVDLMKAMLDAGCGLTRLVTLAPERDPGLKVTRWLADQHILVSAGHCDPSIEELRSAMDAGLSLFTHLGNGCPMMLHRHDNIIQRVLSLCERLTICFIADGVHISVAALGNYLRLVGIDRSIVVTDAIAAARLGPGRYPLGGQSVDVGADLVARSADGSHFVGSTATMPRMVALLSEQLCLSNDDIQSLILRNPCRLLGLYDGSRDTLRKGQMPGASGNPELDAALKTCREEK